MRWVLLLFFISLVLSGAIPDKERYEHMMDYLTKFGDVKEARPMVNKIRNSDDYVKLHKEFGRTKKLDEKNKKTN
jgi:hypothetical protein